MSKVVRILAKSTDAFKNLTKTIAKTMKRMIILVTRLRIVRHHPALLESPTRSSSR